MTVGLHKGFRHFDLFGCDSSYPPTGKSHVDGYETIMDAQTDGMELSARDDSTGEMRKFRTLGYLALQVEEFKLYCQANHMMYSLRVYGDEHSLLKFTHERMFPDQYEHV